MNILIVFVFGLVMLGIGFYVGRTVRGIGVPQGGSDTHMESIRTKSVQAVQDRTEKRKSRIMDLARKQGNITNDDVEDMFCISDSTARTYLSDLEEEGLLIQKGEVGRGVSYEPKA